MASLLTSFRRFLPVTAAILCLGAAPAWAQGTATTPTSAPTTSLDAAPTSAPAAAASSATASGDTSSITVSASALAAAPAQVTPAAGYTPPDDTPSIKVGATIYVDYTYTAAPKATDADGNEYHPNAFNVTRGYININGKVSHIVAFRITPDINAREQRQLRRSA